MPPPRKEPSRDLLPWFCLLAGPLVLLLVLALGVEAASGRPAPALPTGEWLNTPDGKPLRLEDLRGKVVLVEFWAFECYNCRNTLPYVKAWHEKYAGQGLVIVGVHTPELAAERSPAHVRKAVAELGIKYPVALDNDYATWKRYHNHYWPAIYLIDAQGKIVYTTVGEGYYDRTEARIRELLEQAHRAAD